jgi:ABC-type transport system involved in Fe-S cluster assembly fused permease/ATPase subunit
MAARAPNSRVQSILIDMARMWDRLAIEAEYSNEPNARPLHPIISETPPNGPMNDL